MSEETQDKKDSDEEEDEEEEEDTDAKEFAREMTQKVNSLLDPEQIVPRQGWNALPPKQEEPFVGRPDHLIFTYNTGFDHCNDPEQCVSTLQQMQKKHMAEGMSDIPYNFVIGGDSRVYEGRGWKTQPDPSYQYPELGGRRLDIGFLGEYKIDTGSELASDLLSLGVELGHYGVQKEHLSAKYRLLETEENLNYENYNGGKEEIFPELHLYPEQYYPGNPIKQNRLEEILNEDDKDINGYYPGIENTPEWLNDEEDKPEDYKEFEDLGLDLDNLEDEPF